MDNPVQAEREGTEKASYFLYITGKKKKYRLKPGGCYYSRKLIQVKTKQRKIHSESLERV
jgi:hypothetical protein